VGGFRVRPGQRHPLARLRWR